MVIPSERVQDGAEGTRFQAMHACAALQVLVSIQGLVLVPKPYFNEAGYERQVRTRCCVSATEAATLARGWLTASGLPAQ